MSASNDSEMKTELQPELSVDHHTPETSGWLKRKNMIKRISLGLRGLVLFFSVFSSIRMACNKHGDGVQDFDKYSEYKYLVVITILSSLYNGVQLFRQLLELYYGKILFQPGAVGAVGLINFVGDQVVAYLLISSASSAIPLTTRLSEVVINNFTEASASAIRLAFLAFLWLGLSAIISGYKLSTKTYI